MPQTKDKLAEIRENKSAKLDKQAEAVKTRDAANAAWEADGAGDAELSALEKANADVSAVGAELAAIQRAEIATLEANGSPAEYDRQPAGDPADPRTDDAIAAALSGENAALLAKAANSRSRFGQIDVGEVAARETLAADIGTSTVGGLIQPDRRGLLVRAQRALDVLDLMASGTTNSNAIYYVQTSGINSGAVETPEGTVKPELALTFTDATAPIPTIAGWLKLRKQTLEDVPALRSFVNAQIAYAVRRRLNDQAMAGNGTGENIRGLLNTSGVQTATVLTGDNLADRLLKGITSILLTEQSASGIALHPVDLQAALTLRDASGATAGTGGYVFGGPAAGQSVPRIWGLPVVASQAIPQGTALVGDFTQSQVMVRSGLQVLFSDSDQNDFIRNVVTMLGEMRAGLLVWRPDAFCKVNLGNVA